MTTKTPTTKTTNFSTTLRLCKEAGFPDLPGKRLTPNARYNTLKALSLLLTGLTAPPSDAPEIAEKTPTDIRNSWRAIAARQHGCEALGARAADSFMNREIRRQLNRETIARLAVNLLLGGKPQRKDSPREIDDDWLDMFAEAAAGKSDPELQRMLARMLAGEIRKPGSFSPSAIQAVNWLTRKTADQFRRFCNLSLRSASITFVIISPWPDFRTKGDADLGVKYQDLLDLQCAGLVSPTLSSNLDLSNYLNRASFAMAERSIVFAQAQLPPRKPPQTDVILLSPVGHELRPILDLKAHDDYNTRLTEWFQGHGITLSTLT